MPHALSIALTVAAVGWALFFIERHFCKKENRRFRNHISDLSSANHILMRHNQELTEQIPYCHDCGKVIPLGDIANGSVHQCKRCGEEYESG